jgi:hypothetical protein
MALIITELQLQLQFQNYTKTTHNLLPPSPSLESCQKVSKNFSLESKGSEEGGPEAGQESKGPEGSGGNNEIGQGYSYEPPDPSRTFHKYRNKPIGELGKRNGINA